jgi:hypothetical protein
VVNSTVDYVIRTAFLARNLTIEHKVPLKANSITYYHTAAGRAWSYRKCDTVSRQDYAMRLAQSLGNACIVTVERIRARVRSDSWYKFCQLNKLAPAFVFAAEIVRNSDQLSIQSLRPPCGLPDVDYLRLFIQPTTISFQRLHTSVSFQSSAITHCHDTQTALCSSHYIGFPWRQFMTQSYVPWKNDDKCFNHS